MYQRILVATDGSTLSKKAVSSAISMAALMGADLVALKVVPRYPMSYFEGGVAMQADEVARVEKQWSEHGQAVHGGNSLSGEGRWSRRDATSAGKAGEVFVTELSQVDGSGRGDLSSGAFVARAIAS